MKNYIDVGAAKGKSLQNLIKSLDPQSHRFFLIEPTPDQFKAIQKKYKENKNVFVFNFAISNYIGTSDFKVQKRQDRISCSGANSLLEYREDKETLIESWGEKRYKENMETVRTLRVNVVTLKKFIEDQQIDSIEYLHCDTQGSDLRVLESLGEKIKIVKGGVMEASTNEDTQIYKGAENTIDNCVSFLENNGFKVTKIEPNDDNALSDKKIVTLKDRSITVHVGCEQNLYYERVD